MCIKSPGQPWDSLGGKELPLSHVGIYKAEGPQIFPGDYEIPTTLSCSQPGEKRFFSKNGRRGLTNTFLKFKLQG